MRNTILATLLAFGLSAFAFATTAPAPAAAPATNTSQAAPSAKVDPKHADCEKQAKEKGLKHAEHKKFVADCVKAK
jgi:hypothetical protein